MRIFGISFKGQPANYAVIDKTVSRSAQPMKEDFYWLKEQGVTDIVNFRTQFVPAIDFDEKGLVEELGMKYHNIPSVTRKPKAANIRKFLSIANAVEKQGGKVHIHCKAGADRTGMYAFIYKYIKGLGTKAENTEEMIRMGHHYKLYGEILPWIYKFISGLKIVK